MELMKWQVELNAGKVRPVYLILGEEIAIVNDARKFLRQLIPEEEQMMNFAQYDMREVPLAQVLNEIGEPPFFGDYREVVVENPDFLTGSTTAAKQEESIEQLTEYLKNPLDSTVLVFVAPYKKLDARKKVVKALKKIGVMIAAEPLDENRARTAIRDQLKQSGVEITPDAMNVLVARTQGDYTAMVGALPILRMFALASGRITGADINKLVPKQLADSVFDLVNAVLRRDATAALSQYADLITQRQEPLQLIALLEGQFRLLLQVEAFASRGYTQGAAAEQLSIHPYRVKLAWNEIRRLKRADIAAAYTMLVNTEAAMKRGTLSKNLGFELFVLQYAGQGKQYV